MGGTFDPPHIAHLQLAGFVLAKLELDRIYFIPAAIHAVKKHTVTPVEIRYEMIQAAIAEFKSFRVSRIEMQRPKVSYSIDTLRQFKKYEKIPAATELYYILGMDNLYEFHLWKDPLEIFQLARVVILNRPGFQDKEMIRKYPQVLVLDSPLYNISATEIRRKVKSGETVTGIIPLKVEQLIHQYNLYRD